MSKALVVYLMSSVDTAELVEAAVAGGADVVELGFPFSDPLADGPVIRRAAERALAAGMRTQACLEVLAEARSRVDVPLVPMTYASLLEAYGWERFAEDAAAAGASSLIVADLPAGERRWLHRVHLVAPTSTDERLRLAAEQTDGWLYLVTLTGTTGARDDVSPALPGLVERTRRLTKVPLYAGFGIATPEQAAGVAALADGVVVGSRAVEVAEEGPAALADYVRSLRRAIDGNGSLVGKVRAGSAFERRYGSEPPDEADPYDVPVGIVGAGPVGLSCALRLASLGVPSVVLEAEASLVQQGSKACLIQGDVLDVLDKFRCADEVAAEGVTWTVARTYVRGEEISTEVYPRPVGYGPFVNISQHRIQELMLAELEGDPRAEVWWSHRVTALKQDEDGVTVQAETADGPRELRFRYLVACDGVRSSLRDVVGVDWTGYTHGDRFLITDIRARLAQAAERHFHYDPPFNPGRQLVMHAQPDDVWRIDWQLPPDADIEREKRTGELDTRIRAVIGDVPYEIEWLSTYRFYQRVVAEMRVGRVFFAGDAAHALPPYGARGMNSGIQDADNLAWKLAFVLHRRAEDSLLDTYHDERHAAARENLDVTEATIKFMVPPGPLHRLIRNVVLKLAPIAKPLRRHVNSGKMAEPFTYSDSPIVDPSGGHPLVGQLAPDLAVSVDGGRTRLRRLLGATFVVVCFARDDAAATTFANDVYARSLTIPVRVVVVLAAGAGSAEGDSAATVAREEDPAPNASTYRSAETTWYLVRPDGHVAAVREDAGADDLGGLLTACARALARGPALVRAKDADVARAG